MNGSSALNYPVNEQLIGKFHVEKIPVHQPLEEMIPQTTSIPDETGCASRFQMIRVDRNFGRGRWKVNDYEPPENIVVSTIPSVENESNHLPITVNGDSNFIASAALTNSVPVATATVSQVQRIPLNNTPAVIPTANIPQPSALLHGYPSNQSYLLPNHHPQYGYYHFYPPPYSHYAPPWATTALAPPNPYLQPPALAPQSTTNLNDPLRVSDADNNGENIFPHLSTELLQNPQLAAYLYALHHSHPPYVPQPSPTGGIPSYHPVQPPHPQTLPFSQMNPNNFSDIQHSQQTSNLTSPKTDVIKSLPQHSSLITPKTKPLLPTAVNGINNEPITSSPALTIVQPVPSSLISPINIPTTSGPATSLSGIWPYATSGSPLDLTQTAAVTAATAMNLLEAEHSQTTEIPHEFLKELTTPTKQNNTADIDNKISAAMDLVKMHLLSAVREEVTELRQQIRILNEKLAGMEQENAFLRQHIPSEIYAQYIPSVLSSSNDSTTNPSTSIPPLSSSQPFATTSLSTIPLALTQQATLPNSQSQASLSTTNLPLT